MFLKKGAMFGLDARIALTIFGALSVISGAALYSAIQDSKVTALITEFNEVGKATEQYYLDRGAMMSRDSTSKYLFKTAELVENTESSSNWKGPYINLEKRNSAGFSLFSKVMPGKYIALNYRPDTSWAGTEGVDSGAPADCTTAPCFIWVYMYRADRSIAHGLDLKIDGTRDNKNGNVRIWDALDGDSNIYMKYMISPTQP